VCERQGRVPISEWWRSIYDDIHTRMIEVDTGIVAFVSHYTPDRTRSGGRVCKQFQTVLYSSDTGHRVPLRGPPFLRRRLLHLPGDRQQVRCGCRRPGDLDHKALVATDCAQPQLSLLIAVLQEYEGSMASDIYQEYLEVAGGLFGTPATMIQLAM
jgi:hypothetical protein